MSVGIDHVYGGSLGSEYLCLIIDWWRCTGIWGQIAFHFCTHHWILHILWLCPF